MRVIYILFFVFWFQSVLAQTVFTSQSSGGNWNLGTTWDQTSCSSGCVAGVDFPGANDVAFIVGDGAGGGSVIIPSGFSPSVSDIYVQYDNQNVLSKSGFLASTLTINGQLASVDFFVTGEFETPTTNIIENDTQLNIRFTGDNLSGSPAIFSWSHQAPLRNVSFNPSSSSTNIQIEDLTVNSSTVNVQNGTLTINSGFSLAQSGSSTLNINSGTSLVVEGAINGNGTSSSLFGTVTINGTATTGTSGYINTQNFTLGATGILSVAFSGVNQTEGWWFGSNSPTGTFSLDPASTVTYSASTDQTVGTTIYGNLRLTSPINPSVKSLQASNTLTIAGDLVINSANVTFTTSGNSQPIEIDGDITNNGTWSPTQLVRLAGTTAQILTGNNPVTFGGGLRIENTSASVSLSNQDVDINGTFDIDPSANFNPDIRMVNLSGNLINDGTLQAGTNTAEFVFDGTTLISGTGTHNFNNITISGTLTAPSSGNMNVAGDFTNSGIFNRNSGTVVFNGSTDQSLSGTTSFNDITVNSSGTVTNTGLINLYGTFTPTAGGFATGNNFTIMSTSLTNDGRIAAMPGGFSFTGNLTAQRFVDGVFDGDWRYFSSPVVGATLNMWLNSGMPITGSFSDASPAGSNNVISSTAPSVYTYTSSTATWSPVSGSSTSAVTLANGRGYSAYTYVNGDLTLSVTGTLRSGSFNVSLSGAGGADPYYLIGNPYPSPIDWDAVHAANSSLGGTMFIRTANNVYASYNISSGGAGHPNESWGGEILMGQSFWVDNTAAASSIAFDEAMKAAVGNGQFLRQQSVDPEMIRFKLFNDKQSDETVVYFKEGATDAFEYQYDGKKQLNGYNNSSTGMKTWMNLSTYNFSEPTRQYVFNALDPSVCFYEIGVKVSDVPAGTYSLDFNKVNLSTYKVKLIDSFAQNELILSEGLIYEFEVTEDVASKGSERFKLEFSPLEINEDLMFSISTLSACEDDFVEIHMSHSQEGVSYVVLNENNIVISNPKVSDGGELTLYVNKASLSENAVNTMFIRGSVETACISNTIDYNSGIEYDYIDNPVISEVTNAVACTPDDVIYLSASGAPKDGFYRWYESMDALSPIKGENQDKLKVEGLAETKWYYVSAVSAEGCESNREKVIAELNEVVTPQLTVNGQVLIAPEADAYQWYKGDMIIEGATDKELEIKDSGVYKVQIFKGGCSKFSEGREFVITNIDDELFALGLNVYPNPVLDNLHFSSMKNSFNSSYLNLTLYDSKGRIVKEHSDVKTMSKGELVLPVLDLNKGMYILNIETEKKTISLQIFKK